MSGRFTFLRQSSWMIGMSAAAGVLMLFLNKVVALRCGGPLVTEFGVFVVLRGVLTQINIPVSGMQTAFAQLAARSHTPEHDAELSGALRAFYSRMVILWVGLVGVCYFFQPTLMARLQLGDASGLWFTLVAALISLGTPALLGVLQGRQDFVAISKVTLMNNVSMLVAVTLLLAIFPPSGSVAMAGIGLGSLVGFLFASWSTRHEWTRRPVTFPISAFLRRFVPLTVGVGITTYMLTEDSQMVQRFFPKNEAAGYNAARTLGTSVIYLTSSLTLVLFPSVVRSMALSQRNSATAQAVGATLLVGSSGALICTLFPELALKIILTAQFKAYAPMIPYFCWGFLPLAVAILLINTLLAREAFKSIPVLLAIAVAYGITIRVYHPGLHQVMMLMIGFNFLLMITAALLLYRSNQATQPSKSGEGSTITSGPMASP